MQPYIIEICPHEPRATICGANGENVAHDPDVADCRASGDCEPACEYLLSQGVDFRIIARNPLTGEYENRPATEEEMRATCEAIYFESDTDFSDRDNCALYLVWEACAQEEAR